MARGGARNRSGPKPEEGSERSEKRGIVFAALPAKGYTGNIPTFPLPDVSDREKEVWVEAWRSPQAAAWALEPWRHRTIAMWVRWTVRMEQAEAGAALGTVVVRLADQIGMTPAGLKENGWKIADEEDRPRRSGADPSAGAAARSRFTVVNGDGE